MFFAREDTRTPMLVTALAGRERRPIGLPADRGRPRGIALSIALSGWFGAVLLGWASHAARQIHVDAGVLAASGLIALGAA